MKSRRQALKLCLDTAVVVVIEIFNEFIFEVVYGFKLLQVKKFTFSQAKDILHHSIVQAVLFPAHALPDAFLAKHPLVLPVLVLSALVGMKDQTGSIRYFLKGLIRHSGYHTQNRPVRDCVAHLFKLLSDPVRLNACGIKIHRNAIGAVAASSAAAPPVA